MVAKYLSIVDMVAKYFYIRISFYSDIWKKKILLSTYPLQKVILWHAINIYMIAGLRFKHVLYKCTIRLFPFCFFKYHFTGVILSTPTNLCTQVFSSGGTCTLLPSFLGVHQNFWGCNL
jgi:hypothetical protein